MTAICPAQQTKTPAVRELTKLSAGRQKAAVRAGCFDQPQDCSSDPDPDPDCSSGCDVCRGSIG